MKARLFRATVFASVALTTNAWSQASVTMYGRVDAELEYFNGLPNKPGGSSRIRMNSNNTANSYWGIQGIEYLDNDFRAVFRLESDFNTQDGALTFPNQIFSRWATVGVASTQWGTMIVGRQFQIANGIWDFDPLKQTAWSSASLVRGRNWQFTNNSVSYQSPTFGGVDFYGQYSFSNATNWNGNGQTSQGRGDGIQFTYTSALFQVRGIYDEIRNPQNGVLDNVYSYSREYFVGGNVFLGTVKLSAAYQTSHAANVAAGSATVTQLIWGGLTWQATPAVALQTAIYHVNANAGNGNATLYALGGTYNLSKRTSIYGQLATMHNSKNSIFSLEANGVGSEDNPLPGRSQSGFYMEISHYF